MAAPQLSPRVRPTAVILRVFAILLVVVTTAANGQSPAGAGCYALVWSDTSWAPILPDSVNLSIERDTALGHRSTFKLLPIHPTLLESDRWHGLMYTWWRPAGSASIELTFRSVDASWIATLAVLGDSVRGGALFEFNASATDSASVTGRRVPCPNARAPDGGL
jgi:hypothetical protein